MEFINVQCSASANHTLSDRDRFGSRIFVLLPRKFDAISRRISGLSANALIWTLFDEDMVQILGDPETAQAE